MKIAFCNRPSWNFPLGGDGVQMLKTKECLEKQYGVNITIITNPEHLDETFDLIHIFNYVTWRVTEAFFKKGVSLGIPIVSSSIFWDYTYAYDRFTMLFITDHFSKKSAFFLKKMIAISSRITGYPVFFSTKFRNKLNYFVENSRLVLPNSQEEGELLGKFLGKDIRDKLHVVYNGTDIASQTVSINREDFLKKYGIPADYILQVGRIEPVKNQINLLYSLMDVPNIPIVFVGKEANTSYVRKLKHLSKKRGNVFFVKAVPHEDISAFYQFARIHVLLSLRESPGLVSLEALGNNCPIVISSEQYTPIKTYFPDQPYVVDPLNCHEIRKVLLKAWHEREIHNENIYTFSWNVAAKQTFEAYEKALHAIIVR